MSTLELLIAFALLSLSMTAAIVVLFGTQTTGTDAQTNLEALGKAETLLEQERALARQDFTAVTSSGPTADDIYRKQITVSYPNIADPDTKLVTATVTWINALRPLTVKLSTLVTNASSGAFCSPTLSSPTNWKTPTAYPMQTTALVQASPIGSSANGLGVADLAVYRGKLYLAAGATPGSDTHTFYIYSLPSNPATTPTFLGWTNTAGNQLAGITVAPKGSSLYAYVVSSKAFNFTGAGCLASPSTCAQFQVVNVTNPASPSDVAGVMVPITGSGGVGKSVYYANGYAYVGLSGASSVTDNDFDIIDVGGGGGLASPTNPQLVGGYHVGFSVDSIYVSGQYAYLATTDNASGNKQVIVLDISNKTAPHLVGSFSAPGIGVGYALQLMGTKLYFGRAFSGSTVPNFYILDATNPATTLPVLGSKVAGTNDSVNALTVRDHYAFLVTNSQLQIWDVANPASMVPWSSDGTTGTFLTLTSIDSHVNGASGESCAGDYLYLALQTSQGNTKDVVAIVGPGVPNTYSLSNSGDISLTQGNSGTLTITAAVVSGSPAATTFTASGLPAGASASFSPTSCTPGCSSTLTLTTAATTPTGTYTITVTGTGGVTTSFNLTVAAAPPPFDYSLTAPNTVHVIRGTPSTIVATVTKTSGTAASVSVSLTNLPSNVAVSSVSPSSSACIPTSGTCTVTFTVNANTAASKSSTALVTGTSPTHTATISMTSN